MLLQICALSLGAMDENFLTGAKYATLIILKTFDQILKRAMVIILGIKYHIQSYSHYEWLLLQVRLERCAYTTDSMIVAVETACHH